MIENFVVYKLSIYSICCSTKLMPTLIKKKKKNEVNICFSKYNHVQTPKHKGDHYG